MLGLGDLSDCPHEFGSDVGASCCFRATLPRHENTAQPVLVALLVGAVDFSHLPLTALALHRVGRKIRVDALGCLPIQPIQAFSLPKSVALRLAARVACYPSGFRSLCPRFRRSIVSKPIVGIESCCPVCDGWSLCLTTRESRESTRFDRDRTKARLRYSNACSLSSAWHNNHTDLAMTMFESPASLGYKDARARFRLKASETSWLVELTCRRIVAV